MGAFSLDLRERLLQAALRGDATETAVAERFGVSRAFVQKLKRQWRRTGSLEPSTARRGPLPRLGEADRAALAAWIDETPSATADELRRRLQAERAVSVGARTINRALAAMGLTVKKRRSAPTNSTAPTSGPNARRS